MLYFKVRQLYFCIAISQKYFSSSIEDIIFYFPLLYSIFHFDEHIFELCGKINKKVNAFSKRRNYLDNTQAQLLCKTTVLKNFNYCPLIWMFSSKPANKEINRTQKRAKRLISSQCNWCNFPSRRKFYCSREKMSL